jgi:hypothetical protein
MKRSLLAWLLCFVPLGVLLAILSVASAAEDDDWKYDIVYPTRGDPYRGLVVEQNAGGVRMQWVQRRPGRPTIVYRIELARDEIDHVDLLPDDERAALRRRLTALQEEHKRLAERMKALHTGGRESADADKLELHERPWPGEKRQTALAYRSSYFELVSNAPRGVVETVALRLEQVYAAYVHRLPPRARGTATTILLPRGLADYQALVRGRGRDLLNPAYFDPARNEIVCAFDWQHLAEELERLHSYHVKLRGEVDEREAELRKAYKGSIPVELKAALAAKRREIQDAEKRNQATFERAQRRLFQRLFHEAFHAYLLNFVYPPRDGELPRWLNEGLAQIFETAIFEVGELRVGHADEERLRAVRAALARDGLLPLTDLLRSGSRQFQVAHDGDAQASDRYYLASWALSFYLTFERKLLGTPALDGYVRDLKRGRDPLDAFARLTGQPLSAFEREYLDYLKHLRPDGSAPR